MLNREHSGESMLNREHSGESPCLLAVLPHEFVVRVEGLGL